MSSPSLYLLWSPGFLPIFFFHFFSLSLTLLTILQSPDLQYPFLLLQSYFIENLIHPYLFPLLSRYALYSVLSLLSSACCAIQLCLNLFSTGCAGLNTIFGPYRPFFLALTMLIQILQWIPQSSGGIQQWLQPEKQYKMGIIGGILTGVMSLLPEIVWIFNIGIGGTVKNIKRRFSSVQEKKGLNIQLQAEGMKCVACLTAVEGMINRCLEDINEEANSSIKNKSSRTCIKGKKVSASNININVETGAVNVEICQYKTSKDGSKDSVVREIVSSKLVEALTDGGFPSKVTQEDGTAAGDEESNRTSTSSNASSTSASSTGDTTPYDYTSQSSSLFQGVITGLLGSSCCIFQLGLNMLSALDILHVGCAGFNTALGPIRQYIRSVTVVWYSYRWSKLYGYTTLSSSGSSGTRIPASISKGTKGSVESNCCDDTSSSTSNIGALTKRLLISTVISFFLTFLPEFVLYINGIGVAPPLPSSMSGLPPSMSGLSFNTGAVSDEKDLITHHYVVDNMGCEACEDAVNRVLRRQSGVVSGRVTDFEKGEVEITVMKGWGFDEEGVNASLVKAGYELRPFGWQTKRMKTGGGKKKKANPFGGMGGGMR